MADDNNTRSYRSNEPYPRASFKGASGNDPLAELARLIGQTDPFAEFGRQQSTTPAPAAEESAPPWPTHGYAEPPVSPGQAYDGYAQPASPDPFRDSFESAGYNAGQHNVSGYDSNTYYEDDASAYPDEGYDDVPPRRRHLGVIAIAAVLGLAVVGTAGAFGYRALFGSSGSVPPPVIKADTAPTKVVPPNKTDPQTNKLIYDRVGDRGSAEKIVSREEQPIDLSKTPQQPLAPSGMGSAASSPTGNTLADSSGVPASADQPKKVRTIVIRPDGTTDQPSTSAPPPPAPVPARTASVPPSKPMAAAAAPAPKQAAPQRLASAPPISTADAEPPAPAVVRPAPARQAAAPAPRNAPLSLSPNASSAPAPARIEPARIASAPARAAPPAPVAGGTSGAYAVQISSQRSEAEAQAAFRSLQAKYPSQLSGRQPVIRQADLGSKGIYYRAMVGPFANSADAGGFCQNLKAAGGSCLIQKN